MAAATPTGAPVAMLCLRRCPTRARTLASLLGVCSSAPGARLNLRFSIPANAAPFFAAGAPAASAFFSASVLRLPSAA